jgi:hypothetical protein
MGAIVNQIFAKRLPKEQRKQLRLSKRLPHPKEGEREKVVM